MGGGGAGGGGTGGGGIGGGGNGGGGERSSPKMGWRQMPSSISFIK